METLYRVQVNILTFVILAFVLFVAWRKLDKKDPLNRAFILTVTGVMVGLFFEGLSVLLNHHPGALAIVMDNIASVIIFAVAPMISFSFFVFIFRLVLPDKHLKKYVWGLLALPILTNVILAILSPFFGFFFTIDTAGVYARGPLFLMSAISTYIFMMAGVALVLGNFKRILHQDFWLILGIGIVPILGGIAQSLVYGILAMWSSAGVALFLGYLFLQDRMIRLDSMTGAWNRESFYNTYSRRLQLSPEKRFGAIYFDIDNLKMINDTYGHLEGDKAIKLVMQIIRDVLPSGAVICRLGGDEFIVIHDGDRLEDIVALMNTIKQALGEHPDIRAKSYPLTCSFGAELYTDEYASLSAFLSKLDMLMYQEKFSKQSKATPSDH